MTNTITPEQLQTIEEQQDLFYQPLQDKLKQRYQYYLEDNDPFQQGIQHYLDWLKDELTFIDIQIKELQ
jgi:hypothetical protein